MSEETAVVHVIHGPYAGQRLSMNKSEADAAISEGWAIDPFKPLEPDTPDKPAKEPKQLSEDERAHVIEKAEHAALKLRGEEKDHEKDHDKSMKPQHEGGYETREVKPAPAPAPAAKTK